MPRIIIRGNASVFLEEVQIKDASILRKLDGLVYDEERFTDYIGGSPMEDALAAALVPGGHLQFNYREGDTLLIATTEFQAIRPLTKAELQFMIGDTMGQWSDGVGENWTCCSAEKCSYTIMCIDRHDGGSDYPVLQVIEEQ